MRRSPRDRNSRLWRIGRLLQRPCKPTVAFRDPIPWANIRLSQPHPPRVTTAMSDAPVLKRKRITSACNSCRAKKSKVRMHPLPALLYNAPP